MRDYCRPIVHIYCDGGGPHGYGHIRRSLTLSYRLKKDGFDVSVIGLSVEAKKLLPATNYQNDAPQVVVLDCPQDSGIGVMQRANKKSLLTVGLDWFDNKALPLVNISIFPHYPVQSLHKSFVGFEYILIRPEIQHAKNKNLTNKEGQYVFISIGGGDLLNQGGAIANKLTSFGYSVLLVEGPLHDHSQEETYNSNVVIMKDPVNFSELMAKSKFVVANGGGCLFEALYLGKAVFAVPQTIFEKRIIEYIRGLGGVLGCDKNDLRFYTELEINNVGVAGERIIDGNGDRRISSIIQNELSVSSNFYSLNKR